MMLVENEEDKLFGGSFIRSGDIGILMRYQVWNVTMVLKFKKHLTIFIENSMEILNFRDNIKNIKISGLMPGTIDIFFINMLCPWGFTKFVHKCGYVDLDILVQ